MKNSSNRITISILLTIAVFVAVTCSRIYDNVEKFVDGEIVYIDKLDGIIKVQIGYERVEIDLLDAGRIPASQIKMAKAIKTVIECPDFTEPDNRRVIDSICSWVNVTGLTQLKYYELTIYTEDQYGNRSLPLVTSVRPFTEENLRSIELLPPTITASSSAAQIEWLEGVSAVTHQVFSYEWQFTDRGGAVIKYGDKGDKPVIFLENVASETDIPVTLSCKIVPTIALSGNVYEPIIDTVNIQKSLNFRLPSDAEDVIFLKSPAPGSENDLTDDLYATFSWTKTDAVSAYSLKFSLLPNFPSATTTSLNVGDVNEYVMSNDAMIQVFNSLQSKGYALELYWTVTPTTQSASVKTSYRLLKLWKAGIFFQYDRSDWEVLEASSTLGGYPPSQAIDNNLNTFWHSSGAELPHWLIIDMKTPKSVFKFDVHRTSPSSYSDTKKVELFLSDRPESNGSWTRIGAGEFSPTTTATEEPSIEVLTFDNVTEGRYLRLNMLDGRSGYPYVNVAELYVFYK